MRNWNSVTICRQNLGVSHLWLTALAKSRGVVTSRHRMIAANVTVVNEGLVLVASLCCVLSNANSMLDITCICK